MPMGCMGCFGEMLILCALLFTGVQFAEDGDVTRGGISNQCERGTRYQQPVTTVQYTVDVL